MPPGSAAVSETVANANVFTKTEGVGLLSRITSDPKQKKILLIVSASFGGLILLMLILKLILPSGPEGPTKEQILHQQKLENRRRFEKHLDATKRLVQKKDWKAALLEIQLARKIDPKSQIAQEYQENIQKEHSASIALEEARTAMESKQWDVAMAALTRVDNESEYAEEAKHLKSEIDDEITMDLLDAGVRLMKEGKYNQALVKFDEVKRKDPENSQVDELRRDCQKQIDIEERNQGRRKRKKRRKRRRRRVVSTRNTTASTGQILALYKNGEIDRAIIKAEGKGEFDQSKLLKKFRARYNRGMVQAHKTGLAKEAEKNLTTALMLDKQISGGKGKYHNSILKKLAKVCYVIGRDNMSSQKKYPVAYRYFRKTLKYNPNDANAKKQLSILEGKAKSLYESAYIIKTSEYDRATEYLNIVVRIVSPRNIYYTKAKKLLKKLQPSKSFDDGNSGF